MADDLTASRLAVVREHMDSENRSDFDATIRTFDHPRYELIATGDVYDGEDEVRRYFAETRVAFPDQRNEIIALHAAGDTVFAEFWLEGTHLGRLRGMPPTHRPFRVQMAAAFVFGPDTAKIVCERVYFDAATILRQLGLASDPRSLRGRLETLVNHPVTVARAVVNGLRSREAR
jgi:steroid delta-isomerase-like uncharacterized protein